jgi:hypothetical protein
MFSLKPLAAAILVVISAQALADDSLSTQDQSGTANIGDVQQFSAPQSSAVQVQQGEGNDAAALQDNASASIQQLQGGEYNAGYAEQLFESTSHIDQQQAGSFNTAHASQSVGQNNRVQQQQQGSGNFSFVYQESQSGSQGKTLQFGDGNEANIEQLAEGMANNAMVMQFGNLN